MCPIDSRYLQSTVGVREAELDCRPACRGCTLHLVSVAPAAIRVAASALVEVRRGWIYTLATDPAGRPGGGHRRLSRENEHRKPRGLKDARNLRTFPPLPSQRPANSASATGLAYLVPHGSLSGEAASQSGRSVITGYGRF